MIRSKKIGFAAFSGIFLILLLCNFLTDFFVDDFTYIYSLETGKKITGFFQIFGSVKAHALTMNGRVVAHFFAQLFLFLPKWVFNIVNSLVFSGLIFLIYKISCPGRRNNVIVVGIFAAVWIFAPSFGQVFLWLTGACNYLWAYFAGALFVLPYVNRFVSDRHIESTARKVLFFILAFLAGAYSENASAAFICVAVLLVLADLAFYKVKPKAYELVGILCSFVGYVTLYLSPAQWSNKAAEFSLHSLLLNFSNALHMYKGFAPLLILWTVAFVVSIYSKIDRKKLVLSAAFLCGSLLSNFMMIMASYYNGRSSVAPFIMLVIAVFILLSEIFETNYQVAVSALVSVLLLGAVYMVCVGVKDVYVTHRAVEINEQTIAECKEQGQLDVELPVVTPQTKYSVVYEGRYLSTEDATTWPNIGMAKYYGVDSLIGK